MSTSTITVGGQSVTLVAMPSNPALRAVEWGIDDKVGIVTSVFTGQMQAQQWPGADMLSGTLTWPPLTQLQADALISFIMQLRGMANAFQVGDPLQPIPRGSLAGLPVVDNAAPGGNAPGSQSLSTKGWTANAHGVLLQGDWIQLGYRLHRVLDDVNADASGKATFPIWPSLREQPTSDGTSAGWLNATGSLSFALVRSLGNNVVAGLWTDFILSAGLPADAVIQGIYPVITCSYDCNYDALLYLHYGTGMDLTTVNPSTRYWSPAVPGGAFSSTEFVGADSGGTPLSIGNTLAALSGMEIRALLNCTVEQGGPSFPPDCTGGVPTTAVGFAVYYTSATPQTDTQMPAPFAVPTGQGLAWALPRGSQQSGHLPGGTGVFDPSDATGLAVPALFNGGLLATGAKGLFRLAENMRKVSADIKRLTNISIKFQEYR